jgi:hypothetical protein
MPAFTQPTGAGFIVAFHRQDEPVESIYARDGVHAWNHAIHLIVKREVLQAGDTLTVRAADDDDPPAELPAASYSSQHSS